MHLVDEQNDVFLASNLVHHGLESLLKLAAVLGACDHQSQIQRDELFAEQELRHFTADDLLGKPFDDGGLADAGFAEQHRIVFGAAAEDLDDALHLGLAADDGIELALARALGEVAAEGLKRRRAAALAVAAAGAGARRGVQEGVGVFLFVIGALLAVIVVVGRGTVLAVVGGVAVVVLRRQCFRNGTQGFAVGDAGVVEGVQGKAVRVAEHGEQQVLTADVAVLKLGGFRTGGHQQFAHARGEGQGIFGLAGGAGDEAAFQP